MKLNPKEAALVVQFLNEYSDELGNNGCNDWKFPPEWSQSEKETFVKEYHDYNGDPQEFDLTNLNLPDFAVASFLAYKLTLPLEIPKS